MLQKLTLFLGGISLLAGCAKEVAPTGGKKDLIPPKVVKVFPENKTTNFASNYIELEFDELVEANSLKQEMIITPAYNGKWKIKAVDKKVKLEFETPFDTNTTYSFNFRKGIKDLNERNPTDNLKLVFSTGSKIDSMKLKGKVENLFTNKPQLTSLVGLYKINVADTIQQLRRKPTYFTVTDSAGTYQFENIKNGKYRIITFNDKNNNLLYDEKKELLGFWKDTVDLQKTNELPTLYISAADTTETKVKRTIQRNTTYTLKLSEGVEKAVVKFSNEKDSLKYKVENDEIIFFHNKTGQTDSIAVEITTLDSASNEAMFKKFIRFSEITSTEKQKIEQLKISLKPTNKQFVKPMSMEYEMKFDFPITKFDTSKLKLWEDTTKTISYNYRWEDNNQTKLFIKPTEIPIKKIRLVAKTGLFVSMKGDTNTAFATENLILTNETTGIVEGRVGGADQPKDETYYYIIELVNEENQKVVEKIVSKENFLFEKIQPDTYTIRVIEDRNKNGKWDGANFYKNQEAERIFRLSTPLKVKANFELRDVIVPKPN